MLRVISMLLLIASISTQSIAQQKGMSLTELIDLAIKVSPQLKLYEAKRAAASARIEQGTNLPDPNITFGLANMPVNSFAFNQEPMTGKVVSLSQAIPYPGGLRAKADVKAIDTAIVTQEQKDFRNKIIKEVTKLYFDLAFAREKVRLTRESRDLLQRIQDVVRSKFEVGDASLQNLLNVQVMITRTDDRLHELESDEKAVLYELNALLLRDAEAPVYTGTISAIAKNKIQIDELVKLSESNRPELKKAKLLVEKAELMEKSAEYEFYPNFKIALQYSQRDELAVTGTDLTDFLSAFVTFSIPVNYGGNKSEKVRESKQLQKLYRELYNSNIQNLRRDFGKLLASLREYQKREKLIVNELLPASKKTLDAALADFQVGKIDFVNVINAEDDILKIEIELANVRTAFRKKIADIEFLTGTSLINKLQ